MAAVAIADCTVIESSPNAGIKRVLIVTPATFDNSDTIDVVLKTYGMTTLLFVKGFVQTTVGSVVVAEAPTTAVTTGTLTITAGAVGGSDKVRIFEVVGKN